jgi:predicted glycogen debranching enzyme
MVLVAGLEEWLLVEGAEPLGLSAQEYWDGTVFPEGFEALTGVELEGMMPTFHWGAAGRMIQKRIQMEPGVNRTIITYRLLKGDPARLRLVPLFAHRDYHSQRRGPGSFTLAESSEGWAVEAQGIRSHLQVRPGASIQSRPDWYWRLLHRAERERGLDDQEDLFTPGSAEISLMADSEVTVILGTEPVEAGWRAAELSEQPEAGSEMVSQLKAAARQFLVVRGNGGAPVASRSRSVVAGYHWFVDWGRDTAISLAGLTLATGMPDEARLVLATLLRFLDQGLLPNRFPDHGATVEYNTMDATLWLFQALHAYQSATGDWDFIAEWLSSLEQIIDWHVAGTHHGIKVDPRDGLLAGGEEGLALTWMDARVGDWVVTPRRGKPVEINALWFNALQLTADWCALAQRPSNRYRQMALQAQQSAASRFWSKDSGYLFDVIDTPEGDDQSLRPNQLIALGLVYPLIEGDHAVAALDQVTARLLTPFGLRTLSPDDPRYQPRYQGDQRSRDAAYHMGTVWPWLLGPYIDAVKRLHAGPVRVDSLLEPFRDHLSCAGLGSISEIFEPEPPYRPVGCIAQAWSVAEILRHAVTPGGRPA